MERRFQAIHVRPLSVDETNHQPIITDEAVVAAARLSQRYIADRFLPDKAIDVIDEAGARARLKGMMLPSELREMENEVERLRTQKEDAIRTQAFEVAARLRDAERKLRAELEERKTGWKDQRAKTKTMVTEEDIAYVVAKW